MSKYEGRKNWFFFHHTIIVYYYLEGISLLALILHKELNQTPILTGYLRECRKKQNRGSIGLVSLRLFILNLPRRGGNRGTSLPCNFRSFSPPDVSPTHAVLPLLPSSPIATACSNTSVRHPPLFTTSKRRRCFFPLWCAKNFIRSLSSLSRLSVYEIRRRS